MIKEKICGSVYGLVPPKINIYSLIQFQAGEGEWGGAAAGKEENEGDLRWRTMPDSRGQVHLLK